MLDNNYIIVHLHNNYYVLHFCLLTPQSLYYQPVYCDTVQAIVQCVIKLVGVLRLSFVYYSFSYWTFNQLSLIQIFGFSFLHEKISVKVSTCQKAQSNNGDVSSINNHKEP